MKYYTVKQIAAMLQMSVGYVRMLISAKQLASYKIGRCVRVADWQFENWINQKQRPRAKC
jgi:excisionase family DNA binding protein